MPARCRVQHVMYGASGLAEDRFINTFHFDESSVEDPAVYQTQCRDAVIAFYGTQSDGFTGASYWSPYIKRTVDVVSYDLLQPIGSRIPTVTSYTMGTAPAGGLPEEVAVVLTLLGAPPVNARRRGRLFLGPLNNGAKVLNQPTSTTPAEVATSGAGNILAHFFEAGLDLVDNVEVTWCIRSVTPSENFVPITRLAMDTAFDTMRKRGPDARFRSYT